MNQGQHHVRQVADYTGVIIAVTFLLSFFGLAGYMIKRSMDLDKEKLAKPQSQANPQH